MKLTLVAIGFVGFAILALLSLFIPSSGQAGVSTSYAPIDIVLANTTLIDYEFGVEGSLGYFKPDDGEYGYSAHGESMDKGWFLGPTTDSNTAHTEAGQRVFIRLMPSGQYGKEAEFTALIELIRRGFGAAESREARSGPLTSVRIGPGVWTVRIVGSEAGPQLLVVDGIRGHPGPSPEVAIPQDDR